MALNHLAPRRHCKSCTRTCLRTMTSWSCCKETLFSCLRWSRAPLAKAGCLAVRWVQGCPASCLRTTSTVPMSLIHGSSMGKEGKQGCCALFKTINNSFVFCFLFHSLGLSPFLTVPLHRTLAALLVGYFLMDSKMTVYLTVLWILPAFQASVFLCRYSPC